MSLITRTEKGSKLTIQDMDNNLTYLQSIGFVDGEYAQTTQGIPSQLGIGEIVDLSQLIPMNISIPGATGSYTVSPTTDGAGEGAEFELVIINSEVAQMMGESGSTKFGSLRIDYDASSIISGGSGYAAGDTLTILGTDLGGPDVLFNNQPPTFQFNITEASLDTVPAVPSTKTYIQVREDGDTKGIYIAVNEEVQDTEYTGPSAVTRENMLEVFNPTSNTTNPSIYLYQNSNAGGDRVDEITTQDMEVVNIDNNGLATAENDSSGIEIGIGSIATIHLYQGASNSAAANAASNTGGNIELVAQRFDSQLNGAIDGGDIGMAGSQLSDGDNNISITPSDNNLNTVNLNSNIVSSILITPESLTLSNNGAGDTSSSTRNFGSNAGYNIGSIGGSTITLENSTLTIDTIALFLPNIPQYSDNLEATNDGYPIGGVYRGPIGDLRIVTPEAPTEVITPDVNESGSMPQ